MIDCTGTDMFIATRQEKPPHCVPGTAVFLTSDPAYAPTALMHSLKHYKVLHEKNIILTIDYAPLPRVDPAERVQIKAHDGSISVAALAFSPSWCWRHMRLKPSSASILRRRKSITPASYQSDNWQSFASLSAAIASIAGARISGIAGWRD
jgi:hypothetical protein